MTNTTKTIRRRFQGIVVTAGQQKTIVVRVNRVRMNPIYKKRFTVSKHYQVHDEANRYQVGDNVEFVECRPLSKQKKWRVIYKSKV